MPLLGFTDGECLSVCQACCQCLFMPPQLVGSYHLAMFFIYWSCLFMTLQSVSSCYISLCFKSANYIYSWFSRLWVSHYPVELKGGWQHLSLALQEVSGCDALLHFIPADDISPLQQLSSLWVAVVPQYFKPSDSTCPLLSRLWVAATLCSIYAYWKHQSTAFQFVCGCYALLYFELAYHAFSGFFSQWAVAVPHWVSRPLTIPVLDSPACEWLSCLTPFKLAYNIYSHPSSLWVAAMLYCISSLLKTLLLALQYVSGCWTFVFHACWQHLFLMI